MCLQQTEKCFCLNPQIFANNKVKLYHLFVTILSTDCYGVVQTKTVANLQPEVVCGQARVDNLPTGRKYC